MVKKCPAGSDHGPKLSIFLGDDTDFPCEDECLVCLNIILSNFRITVATIIHFENLTLHFMQLWFAFIVRNSNLDVCVDIVFMIYVIR